jgi:hypothetical protein
MTALNPPNNRIIAATAPPGLPGAGRPSPAAPPPPRARDHIDLSRLAKLLDRLRQMDAARSRKVAAIKREVDADTYETDEKLEAAVGALIADLA